MLQKYLNDTTEMAVWKITESVEELRKLLWMFEHEEFKFESRNLHWLASRVVLQELLKTESAQPLQLLKMPNGRPYIEGLDCRISLSHSGIYAAAIKSTTGSVGIDIEETTERIKKIAHKFINDYEWQYLEGENDLETMYLLWAGKEAIFKWYGDGGVDFKHHMKILLPIANGAHSVDAVLSKNGEQKLTLHTTLMDDNYRLCWVFQSC